MNDEASKAFISYAWTSPTHQSWVLNLAIRLRQDGVDVTLDKWDLKPGHDAIQFMEQMVTDKSVRKVLMICNRLYVEKADGRSGGVGTESQIISPQLYKKATQDKYAALITEEDEGISPVPVFYGGRIYFDFKSPDNYDAAYDELLRWLLDKPLYVKPPLGQVPSSIATPTISMTVTATRSRRASAAIREGHVGALGLLREYADDLVDELPKHGPKEIESEYFDDAVVASIEALHPYVREFQDVVKTVANFSTDRRLLEILLTAIERLAVLMFPSQQLTSFRSQDFDSFKYVVSELFVTTVAILIREQSYDFAASAIRHRYIVGLDQISLLRGTRSFCVLRQNVQSLDFRNNRLFLRNESLHAELMYKTYKDRYPAFEDIMQAEFILYLRALKFAESSPYGNRWLPITIPYFRNRSRPFEIFARGESQAFFSQVAALLGTGTTEVYRAWLRTVATGELSELQWGINILELANAEHLGTAD